MKKGTSQEKNVLEIKLPDNAGNILKQVIEFLQIFLPVTLAKRLAAIVLLTIGMPVRNAVELTGLCERSMWSLKKGMQGATVAELLVIKSGSGRKGKTAGIEEQIIAEVESNNYHTLQQIADLVEEKFHVRISRSSVGRLLKKRHQMAKERLTSCQSGYREAKRIF